MTENPPPLISPAPGLDVRAVLDQDALVTAGLAIDPQGRRVGLLMANRPCDTDQRREFLLWCRSLQQAARVAPIGHIVDYGCTPDGRAFLAQAVTVSLADQLRRVGQPSPERIREMGATVADALAAVHAEGLVHGAVSPATILVYDEGCDLGGFGVTAPGLTGPLGVWAFTPPEHRKGAAEGSPTASAAGDVFALAATLCVALAGTLPWSDPTTWAQAAGVPDGKRAPAWATVLRGALSEDPARRPDARTLAGALRLAPGTPRPDTLGPRLDLRGLIPRAARRLAATSIDAMAEGVAPVSGRAVVSEDPIRFRRTRAVFRNHAKGIVTTAIVAIMVGCALFRLSTNTNGDGSAPRAYGSDTSGQTQALMSGARAATETFLHRLGAGDHAACAQAPGASLISVPTSSAPVSCAYLLAHETALLSAGQRTALRSAKVLAAVGVASGSDNGDTATGSTNAFVSLPYVPSLGKTFNRVEITLSYRSGSWSVVEVTLA